MRTPISLALVALLATPALAVDITAPGQTVPKHKKGVVQADLVCAPGEGLALENGATLDLNGHTLDGCDVNGIAGATERIRISVRGPGQIRNAGIGFSAGTLRVRDVVVQDAPGRGISGASGVNGGPSTLQLNGVTVTGSAGAGIEATRVFARDVTVSGGGEQGIVGWRSVSGSNVVLTGNQEGVFSAVDIRLRDSQVTGNTTFGVIANLTVAIIGSTVNGNGTDLASQILPRVKRSTCETSLNMQTQLPWGVCSAD